MNDPIYSQRRSVPIHVRATSAAATFCGWGVCVIPVIAVLKLLSVPGFDRKWSVLLIGWVLCLVINRIAGFVVVRWTINAIEREEREVTVHNERGDA